ncbi:McrB domain protein [Fusobacterium pseudoperiodonticum]|nr:McrB domain protein [Fusobacterium pseudoperiodonticum]
MCSIICCSIYIIQRKFIEDETNLESFKGHFLNGLIKYIPSDKEYSLKEFCNKVKEDKYNNNYVLIFENIDKRDKSKIFGEDFSKLKERICNKEDSELPKNLYILATTSKTSFHIEDIEFFKNFDFEKIDSNDEYIKNIGEMDEEIKEIFKINKKDFKFPLNTILYGPPGTGKTYNSIFYSVGIIKKDKSIIDIIEDKTKNISDIEKEEIFNNFNDFKEQGQIEFVTFHQSYSYEDFVEGIRPTLTTKDNEIKENSEDKKDLKYTIHSGIFKNICERAKNNQDKNYVLIIDEINRGNISKIFGELITLLEPTKRLEEIEELKIRLPYSGEEFGVPKNLYILGTMNTADRSIALLDIALRRRFNFIEMPPKYDLLKEKIEVENDKIELRELLKAINNRIEFLLDRDHLIGHSYLVKVETFDDLKEVFRNSIMPLLQEYFYDDFEKIKFVLNIKDDNNNFIIKKEIPKNFSDALKNKIEKKPIYLINEKAFNNCKNYIKIYN